MWDSFYSTNRPFNWSWRFSCWVGQMKSKLSKLSLVVVIHPQRGDLPPEGSHPVIYWSQVTSSDKLTQSCLQFLLVQECKKCIFHVSDWNFIWNQLWRKHHPSKAYVATTTKLELVLVSITSICLTFICSVWGCLILFLWVGWQQWRCQAVFLKLR